MSGEDSAARTDALRGMAFSCRRESSVARRAVEKMLKEAKRDKSSIVFWRGCVESMKDVGCWIALVSSFPFVLEIAFFSVARFAVYVCSTSILSLVCGLITGV